LTLFSFALNLLNISLSYLHLKILTASDEPVHVEVSALDQQWNSRQVVVITKKFDITRIC
jgi:hypothetical protein